MLGVIPVVCGHRQPGVLCARSWRVGAHRESSLCQAPVLSVAGTRRSEAAVRPSRVSVVPGSGVTVPKSRSCEVQCRSRRIQRRPRVVLPSPPLLRQLGARRRRSAMSVGDQSLVDRVADGDHARRRAITCRRIVIAFSLVVMSFQLGCGGSEIYDGASWAIRGSAREPPRGGADAPAPDRQHDFPGECDE